MNVNVSEILKGVGFITGIFNPVFGNNLIAISSIIDKFDGIPDDVLENNFIGFSKSSEFLKEIAKKDVISDIDREKLLLISNNLEDMNLFLEKIFKILK